LFAVAGCAQHRAHPLADRVFPERNDEIAADFGNFYNPRNLAWLAGGVGVAAGLANSSIDDDVRDWYQDDVRNSKLDQYADVFKTPGYGELALPALGIMLLVTEHMPDSAAQSTVGEWSDRSLRGILVGFPMVLAGQRILGASRPGEEPHGSHWDPWNDSNAVSGHAFMGAVPLITMAQMVENPYAKGGLYFSSTLCGWSRVNDDAHYLSQAVLGWYVAYLAASAVSQTELQAENWSIAPMLIQDGVGIGFEFRH
jgi:hypothetical protein